jgi:hypothetical protein
MRVAERFFAGAAERLRTAVSLLRTLELAQLRPIQSGGQSWLLPRVDAWVAGVGKAVFSSPKIPKILQDSLLHQIFGRMYGALNVCKKNN